mmetsp:Transcript_20816/g.31796  ORF Transcript_20816/g.31796 Transcript_20816/m.31796 type:complete len:89 (+) Transcript_20816:47-313(+)
MKRPIVLGKRESTDHGRAAVRPVSSKQGRDKAIKGRGKHSKICFDAADKEGPRFQFPRNGNARRLHGWFTRRNFGPKKKRCFSLFPPN